MAQLISPCVLLFLFSLFVCVRVQCLDEGYVTEEISNKGLDFIKDLLIQKAESSLVPLELPKIEKDAKYPILGYVDMVLSNITMERINVTKSTLRTRNTGIVIDVSGATANLSMDWKYSYSTWLLPIAVSDKGNATVQVEGLDVGLSLSLKTLQGSPKLSLLECGCNVNDISIKLDGGASWLYQGLLNAFESKISSAVEVAVSNKIKDAVLELDSVLQSLPKDIPITNVATLNITLVKDPELSESSLKFAFNGLFSANNEVVLSSHNIRSSQASFSCEEEDKMVKILLHEEVLKSASSVYFEAGKMHWIVDKVSDQSLLNTAGWRFVIPQLYKMYPNDDMTLNLSVSSPPIIKVEMQKITVTVPLDVVINVLDVEEVIPVVCISMMINTSAYAEISRNAVVGNVKLNDFSLSLEWSKIGELHMRLIKTFMSTALKTVILPYINFELAKGYKLPVFRGLKLEDAHVLYTDSSIMICSDFASVKRFNII